MKVVQILALLAASLLCLWPPACEGARILGVFGHIGKSHFDMFEPLMLELARRGHQVVVISHFPQRTPVANYTDISLKGTITDFSPTGQIDVSAMKVDNLWDSWNQMLLLRHLTIAGCNAAFNNSEVQRLLQSGQKFDLLITELFTSDCYLAFAHHFKVPHITMSSCMLMPWAFERFGNPQNPAYIPGNMHQFGMRMSFWERFENMWKIALDNLIYEFMLHQPTEQIARRYFKDLPPLKKIAQNVSLMLLNTHVSLTHARPTVPAIVEVGGIHLTPRKPLPKDIQEFLDGGSDGVVYFNMGSMIRATSLRPEKREAFLRAFARLGRRVLWKWEEATMPGQTANVRTSSWLPQNDVLSHPNVRVYVGHGGLLGSIEAANAGVPMLALPIFGDQRANVQNLVQAGMARMLDYNDVTEDSVFKALSDLLENPKYYDAAQRVSRAFRDRPQAPLDTAVYWTEHVIRHGGAPHLRCVAADIPWYQRWLLDVAALSLAVLAFILYVLKFIASLLFGSKSAAQKLKGE